MKVIGIKFEIKPPRLCCLKLGIMEGDRSISDTFTIKYHDTPDVLDFLVLKQIYDIAVKRIWKSGKSIVYFYLKYIFVNRYDVALFK